MHIITFIAFWLLGLVVGSFALIQSLICIFCGIPLTHKFTKQGLLLVPNPIIKQYWISFTVLFSVFCLVSVLVWFFGPENALNGYTIGIGFMVVFGIGKTGENQSNLSDYMESNAKYFKNTTV